MSSETPVDQRPAIDISDSHLDEGVQADDVDALVHRDEIWLAWTRSSLDREDVYLEKGESIRSAGAGIRPRLECVDRKPHLVFCMLQQDRLLPALVDATDDAARPHVLPCQGNVHQIALSRAPHGAWIAWLESAEGSSWISVGFIDSTDGYRRVARFEGRALALASIAEGTRIAWIDDRGLWVGRATVQGVVDHEQVSADKEAEAVALHGSARGSWLAAWHAPLEDGVLHWLHLARRKEGAWELLGPRAFQQDVDAAGVDQGWEFPDVLEDHEGNIWLTGRSSRGFHVQALTDRGWTPRTDVSHSGWSGRSRTCRLFEHRQRVSLIRGTWHGLRVSELTLARSSAPRKNAPRPASVSPPATPPLSKRADRIGQQILFGDLHQHSIHSDGTGSAEDAYRRARDRYKFDLVALTDHELFSKRCVGPATWRYMCQVADAFYDPGRLVTLPAYEFTGSRPPGPGHKCVYFGNSVPAQLPPKETGPLLEMLRLHDAIAVPHHVGWTGADMEHHDPILQPVWEICSVHGAYERQQDQVIAPRDDVVLEGQFVQDALAAGLVFGFIGGTDSHGLLWHHGVSRKRDPFVTGLTAVFAEPTRASVLQALRDRRCYATSGARIGLRVDVEGAPMGSIIAHDNPLFHVGVEGTAPIERLSIIQDGQEVHTDSGDAHMECSCRIRVRRPWSCCYARILQQGGEMAWSSPVWISPVDG